MRPLIKDLNERLRDACAAYYSGDGSNIMTDAEYDMLEAVLAGLVRQYPAEAADAPVLTTIGTDTTGRIPHEHPMRSIQNMYTVEELIEWAESLDWPLLTLEPKWDGIGCSLKFEGGDLMSALTRGDGEAGENIFAQVLATESIPKRINPLYPVEIRGELVIGKSTLDHINQEIPTKGGNPYTSTRNLLAGTIKLRNLDEVARRDVQFRPWEVISKVLDDGTEFGDSHVARLLNLKNYGFYATHGAVVRDEPTLKDAILGLAPMLTELQEIACDGLVLKVDSCSRRRELSVGTKFSNYQRCFKAQNARGESVLRHFTWQVGRQGHVIPVGIIDPLVLAGTTIERVTLNNARWIEDMGLKIGSRVVVVRSGDVVPQITEVLRDE
jgi:DNA ligase (NAD+)